MMKNPHTPHLTWIGSWRPEVWPHEYLISSIEISVNWSGSWIDSHQIWAVGFVFLYFILFFIIMLHRYMVSKTLKCKKKKKKKKVGGCFVLFFVFCFLFFVFCFLFLFLFCFGFFFVMSSLLYSIASWFWALKLLEIFISWTYCS